MTKKVIINLVDELAESHNTINHNIPSRDKS